MNIKLNQNKTGTILGLTLVYMIVFTLLGYGLLTLASFDKLEASRAIERSQAFWIAEAGLEMIKTLGQQHYYEIETYMKQYDFDFGNNKCNLIISPDTTDGWDNSTNLIKKYWIKSRGKLYSASKKLLASTTLEVHAEVETFASYAYATNTEGAIWFITGDHIDGPLYTNDFLHISGNPVFDGVVKSAKSSINYYNGGPPNDNPDFKQGIQLGAPLLDISKIFDPPSRITPIINAAGPAGTKTSFIGDATIEFLSNGTMKVTNAYLNTTLGNPPGTAVTMSLPLTEAIYVNGNATVSGVVDGKVTIATENSIYLPNNVTYAYPSNPLDVFNQGFDVTTLNDSLGLIARNDVVITKPYNSGDKDITIHASVLATQPDPGHGLKGSFRAQDYASRTLGGKINLFGGITQYERGPVGTFSGASPVTGFTKNYKYNTELLNHPPPHTPYSSFKLNQWKQGVSIHY